MLTGDTAVCSTCHRAESKGGKAAHQIKAGPGSCCLFSQEHIHGSGMPNTTGKTRISMDFRIAEGMYGDLLGRKMPAGYFHLIPDTEEEEERLAQLPPLLFPLPPLLLLDRVRGGRQ